MIIFINPFEKFYSTFATIHAIDTTVHSGHHLRACEPGLILHHASQPTELKKYSQQISCMQAHVLKRQTHFDCMKKFFLIAAAMAVLVFSACKKDKDNHSGSNGGGNGKLLKKVTKTEAGHTVAYNLNYDGNKRLTSITSNDGSETTSFTYDNAGNVTKVERKEGNYYTTFTYTYNNGIPVSGTLKLELKVAGEPDDLQQDDEFTYTVTNNQVTKIHTKNKTDGLEYDITLSYKPNGNLEKAVYSGHEDYSYSVVYTYGNKKPAFPTLSKWVLDLGFSLEFAANNALISTLIDLPGDTYDLEFTTTYTYDAAGYPITSGLDGVNLKYEYQ